MKAFCSLLLLTASSIPVFSQNFENPVEVIKEDVDNLARSLQVRAYDWIGSLSNLGYQIRDGRFIGSLAPCAKKLISTYLFAGNRYWFCITTNPGTSKIHIGVINEAGNREEVTQYYGDSIFAVGIEPRTSGRYFILMEMEDGERTEFCLIYAYQRK